MTSKRDRTKTQGAGRTAGASDRARSDTSDIERLLSHVISDRILPKLVKQHQIDVAAEKRAASSVQGVSHAVAQLARACVAGDDKAADAIIKDLRDQGAAIDTLISRLMADTARYIGQLWVDDVISYFETTQAAARLQKRIRSLSMSADISDGTGFEPQRILLTAVPGEQHVVGIAVLEHFFRRAGWEVWYEPGLSTRNLTDLVRMTHFSIVGLTVGDTELMTRTAHCISLVRRHSCNPQVGVLVGGHIFQDQPELVSAIGADATANTGRSAVLQANRVMALVSGARSPLDVAENLARPLDESTSRD